MDSIIEVLYATDKKKKCGGIFRGCAPPGLGVSKRACN